MYIIFITLCIAALYICFGIKLYNQLVDETDGLFLVVHIVLLWPTIIVSYILACIIDFIRGRN